MTEAVDSCVKPARGPIANEVSAEGLTTQSGKGMEAVKVRAQVGKVAPDFELSAYVEGGFKNLKLSDYRGQWVVLCFYPGDFTFV